MNSAGKLLIRAVLPGLWVCALQAGAQAIPPEFKVNKTTNAGQFDSDVSALSDGRFFVAWHDTNSLTANAQRFKATAAKVGGEITVPDLIGTMGTSSSVGPRVTGLAGGGAVVAWTGTEDDVANLASANGVAAQVFEGNFVKLGAKIHVNTKTAGRQTVGGVAPLRDGGFVVTWESAPVSGATGQDGSGRGIYARRFNADASPAGGEFRVNSSTTGDQIQPRIAGLANGGFVIVWMDDEQFTFKAQRFSASGNAVGDEIPIGGSAESTAVAGLEDGGFVALWTGPVGGAGLETCVRQYSASGVAVTGEFQVNTYNAGTQRSSAIAGLANGGYVVLWTSDDQDGSKAGVYGQKFTPASGYDGAEFRVNVETTNAQSRASVAALGNGFVATWSSNGQDGSSWGIYGRLFGDTSAAITGTAGPDDLFGTMGDDIVNGKVGADVMTGLDGNDTYFVDDADDEVVESSGEGLDAVRSSLSYALPTHVENLVLSGSSAINGTGNNKSGNFISGNSGDNKLNGRLGNDVLTGNSGQDRFQFTTELDETTNVDFINDFSVVDDLILLEGAIFTALNTTGTLPKSRFRGGGSAATTEFHRITYNPKNGSLNYDADGNGPIAAIRFARLAPGLALTNENFFVQ